LTDEPALPWLRAPVVPANGLDPKFLSDSMTWPRVGKDWLVEPDLMAQPRPHRFDADQGGCVERQHLPCIRAVLRRCEFSGSRAHDA
jgi:hypothetical protein